MDQPLYNLTFRYNYSKTEIGSEYLTCREGPWKYNRPCSCGESINAIGSYFLSQTYGQRKEKGMNFFHSLLVDFLYSFYI